MRPNFKPVRLKPVFFDAYMPAPPVGMPTRYDRKEPRKRGKPLTKNTIKNIAYKKVRNSHRAITGSRALTKQLPSYRRAVDDVDIWSHHPEHDMDVLEDVLDKRAGGDAYYERALTMDDAQYCNKDVFQVVDRSTNRSVLDFSKKPPAPTIEDDGINYEALEHIRQKLILILNDPRTNEERYRKSLRDLRAIERYLKE